MDKKKPPLIIGVLKSQRILAVFLLIAFFYGNAQNPKIKCYFNHPVNNSVSTGTNAIYLNGTFVDTTVAYINRALYSLDICMYNYTYNSGDGLDAIANAVNAAYNRGVVVRWIYEGSNNNSGLPLLNANIQTVGSPTTSAYGISHNKFMIIDANSSNLNDPIVWTGSFNFSRYQADNDYNNIIIVQDKPLALAYYAEFNKMWGGTGPAPNLANSKFGPFKTPSSQTSFTVNGTPVEVYFSPMDNSSSKLQNAINSANNELFFGIYTFTDNTVANAIVNRINGGVDAYGIIDQFSQSYNPYSTLSPLMGSKLRLYTGAGTHHNKMMLVDALSPASDPQVFTGSYNWSISGDTKNDENTLVVHDAVLANQYYQSLCKNFTDAGGTACPLIGVENFDSGLSQFAVYPNPAQDVVSIKIKNAGVLLKIRISDCLGNTVQEGSVIGNDEMRLEIKSLSAGIYFVHILRGDRTFTEKLLKQ